MNSDSSQVKIAIIDYGMGNLRSVQKAFEKVGYAAEVTSDPQVARRADKIVLPGVGAFEDAIAELHRHELVQPVIEAIRAGKPFLGICLGLQLLFERSYENGEHQGLGVLQGDVVRLNSRPSMPSPTWVGTSSVSAGVLRSSTGSRMAPISTSSTPIMSFLATRG